MIEHVVGNHMSVDARFKRTPNCFCQPPVKIGRPSHFPELLPLDGFMCEIRLQVVKQQIDFRNFGAA